MKKRAVQLWVDNDFRTEVKLLSAEKNMSIYECTRKLAEELKEKKKKEGLYFDFKI